MRSHLEVNGASEYFYSDRRYSDVTLKVGKNTFHAHRLVLSAWSDYFKTSLCSPDWMPEGLKKEEELHEEGFCVPFFEEFFKFMYTSTVNLTKENVLPLIRLAEKYLVKELTDLCESFIHDFRFDPETIVSLLNVALEQDAMDKYKNLCIENLKTSFNLLTPEHVLRLDTDVLVSVLNSGFRLVVDNEYTVFMKIEPWLNRCENANDFQKIITLVRFPYMNALQLKKATTSEIFTMPRRLTLSQPCQRSNIWMQKTLFDENVLTGLPSDFPGPRLYLNKGRNVTLDSVSKEMSENKREVSFEEIRVYGNDYSYSDFNFFQWVGNQINGNVFYKQDEGNFLVSASRNSESPHKVDLIVTPPEGQKGMRHVAMEVYESAEKRQFFIGSVEPDTNTARKKKKNRDRSQLKSFRFTAVYAQSVPSLVHFRIGSIVEPPNQSGEDSGGKKEKKQRWRRGKKKANVL